MTHLIATQWLWYMTFLFKMLADLIICVSLCVVLSRRKTGVRRYAPPSCALRSSNRSSDHITLYHLSTDSIIRVLMVYTINTSALTKYAFPSASLPSVRRGVC